MPVTVAGAMDVAVSFFLFGRVSDFRDFNGKVERLSRQRVVPIDEHALRFHGKYREGHGRLAFGDHRLKMHSGLYVHIRGKGAALEGQPQGVLPLPVALFR